MYFIKTSLGIILVSLSFTSGSFQINKSRLAGSSFTDIRDGNNYSIARLTNRLVWMTENLKYDSEGSNCENNKPQNCIKYGRLYTRSESKIACPNGWRLPTKDEFQELFDRHGSGSTAFEALKIGGASGFRAKLFGYWQGRKPIDSGKYGFYWASEDYYAGGWALMLESINGRKNARLERTQSDTDEFSCRCVREY